jgi:hypothetical protein
MPELGTETATLPAEPLWQVADLQYLQRQWESNEAWRRKLLRYVAVGFALLLASIASLAFAAPRMVGSRWAIAPAIAIWASLLLTAVPTVNLWASWRIRRALVHGLAEARAYLSATGETSSAEAFRRDGAGLP